VALINRIADKLQQSQGVYFSDRVYNCIRSVCSKWTRT